MRNADNSYNIVMLWLLQLCAYLCTIFRRTLQMYLLCPDSQTINSFT